ncbi:hypothetical protein GJU03_01100 [Enterobacteriaceae endosymbiont of Donacia bicoloricornis]|uniref:OmpH family outer membrane protein n=1 Tax=Enterobacteriaceae endosymbiont of Donacia bicoloricornis TaxID=2675772 RepID=UPI00144943AE|nr:OmpH family outer membrane protein [Enterobacteriaceae endosymbiont of Donacia bicoloricornis]QJC37748.1 hypothetical protein GJU03_01100 [Enterobacteriaceae endosymbiont of Donacia bicoloricornis]
MKNYLKNILLLMILIIPFNNGYCCPKIVIINIAKIFYAIPQKNSMSKKLEQELNADFLVIEKMKKLLLLKVKKLQHEKLSKKNQERIQKEILYEKNILLKKIKIFTKKNTQKQEQARNKILIFIYNLINIIAKKGNYNLVLDASAVAYMKDVKDITNDVIDLAKQQNNVFNF